MKLFYESLMNVATVCLQLRTVVITEIETFIANINFPLYPYIISKFQIFPLREISIYSL